MVGVFELGKSAGQIDHGDPAWFNSATGLIEGASGAVSTRRRGDPSTRPQMRGPCGVRLRGVPVSAVAGGLDKRHPKNCHPNCHRDRMRVSAAFTTRPRKTREWKVGAGKDKRWKDDCATLSKPPPSASRPRLRLGKSISWSLPGWQQIVNCNRIATGIAGSLFDRCS